MRPLTGLIAAAATARLASIISTESISDPLRIRLDKWALGKKPYSLPERVAYLVSCPKCSSVWAAGIVLALQSDRRTRPLVTLLAVSQAAITILHTSGGLE